MKVYLRPPFYIRLIIYNTFKTPEMQDDITYTLAYRLTLAGGINDPNTRPTEKHKLF